MRILSQGAQIPALVQENLNRAQMRSHHGRVAEWLNVPPWKGGIRKFRIEGSNPSPSARENSDTKSQTALSRLGFFVFGDVVPQKNGRLAEPVGELTDSTACLFGELDSLLNRFIR